GQPALLAAAGGEEDDSAGVLLLLKFKAKVDARNGNGNGRSALHEAALSGHREIVESLLAAGANAAAPDCHGRTALHEAARGGHLAVLEHLLGHLPQGGGGEGAVLAESGRHVVA